MKRRTLLSILLTICLSICLVATSCSLGGTDNSSTSSEAKSETEVSKAESDTSSGDNTDSGVTTDSSNATTDESGEVVDSGNTTDSSSEVVDSSTTDSSDEVADSSTTDSSNTTTDTSDVVTDSSDTTDSSSETTDSSGETTDSSNTTESSDETTDSSDKEPEDDICTDHKGGQATCEKLAECEICGEEYGVLADHIEETIEGKEPTCTETGLTEGKKCSVCGEIMVEQEKIPANGHDYNDENICKVCNQEKVSEGLEFKLSNDGTYYEVSGIGTCIDTKIVVPRTYKNVPVTKIGAHALAGYKDLTSVSLPNSITGIASNAFSHCSSLASISFEENSQLTIIGAGAFQYCSSLISIEIPRNLTVVGNDAFRNCTSLTSVNFEDGSWCNIIGNITFGGCTSLVSIELPSRLSVIDALAFRDCTNLMNIEIPAGVTRIGNGAFEGCKSIRSIKIPSSVKATENYAFCECEDIVIYCEAESMPNGWEKGWNYLNPVVWNCNNNDIAEDGGIYLVADGIRYRLIEGKAEVVCLVDRSITDLNILANVEYKEQNYSVEIVCSGAFDNLDIQNVTIPNGIKEIKYGAFESCRELTNVVIPNSVTKMGEKAFSGCIGLLNVALSNNLESIEASTFCNCVYLEGVTIPSSVDYIGKKAFYMCRRLASVVFEGENECQRIEEEAFSDCIRLKGIVIPKKVTQIGNNAFYTCEALENVAFEEGNLLEIIGTSAFYKCISLSGIVLPNSITNIGKEAFNGSGILEITVPASVTSIGKDVFKTDSGLIIYCEAEEKASEWNKDWNSSNCPVVWNCRNNDVATDDYIYVVLDGVRYAIKDNNAIVARQSIYIKEATILASITYNGQEYSVTEIKKAAFALCVNLNSVTFCAEIKRIGENAFNNCKKLKTINYLGNVADWCNISFANGSANPLSTGCLEQEFHINGEIVTELVIPSDVKEIKSYAFYRCSKLDKITMIEGVESICESAFVGCNVIVIPSSVIKIEKSAIFGTYVEIDENSALFSSKEGNLYSKDGKELISVYLRMEGVLNIQEGVIKIGKNALENCDRLTGVIIPNSVTEIGAYAFSGCSGLTTIIIPNSVTEIGAYAFSRCSGLTTITISKNVSVVGYEAFGGNRNLTIYCEAESQPDSWNSMWNSSEYAVVVWNCKSNDVAENGYIYAVIDGMRYALKDGEATVVGQSTSITKAEIPTAVSYKGQDYAVTSIGSYAFNRCPYLTSVTIPSSVIKIEEYAFKNCDNLSVIFIPNSVITMEGHAFEYCGSLMVRCEAEKQPSGWNAGWSGVGVNCEWGCKQEG